MQRKESTPERERKRTYEERHKEERKAKYQVWGTSVPRKKAEEINEFLNRYGITKLQLIEAGYNALIEQVAEQNNKFN